MNPKEAVTILMKAGRTQVDIAREIGVSPSSLSKILGGVSPKYETGLHLVALGRKAAKKLERQGKTHASSEA